MGSKEFSNTLVLLSILFWLGVAVLWQLDNPQIQAHHENRIKRMKHMNEAFMIDRMRKLMENNGVRFGLFEQEFHEPNPPNYQHIQKYFAKPWA